MVIKLNEQSTLFYYIIFRIIENELTYEYVWVWLDI